MVNHNVGLAVLSYRKAVVTGTKASHFLVGVENGLGRLVPGGRVHQISMLVGPQKPHGIGVIGSRCRISDKDFTISFYYSGTFIHCVGLTLPRVLRLGNYNLGALQTQSVHQFGHNQTRIVVGTGILRPNKVALSTVLKSRDRKSVV